MKKPFPFGMVPARSLKEFKPYLFDLLDSQFDAISGEGFL